MNAIIPVQQGEKWEWVDAGLLFNQEDGRSFWHKGDLIQGRGEINGVEVFVSYCSRWGDDNSFYAVSVFGQTCSAISKAEAIDIIENVRDHTNGDYIDAECSD